MNQAIVLTEIDIDFH